MSPSILRSFYSCTVESILTGCITAWFGNSTAGNSKALQRVVQTARHIVRGELPSLQDIYTRRCIRKTQRIIKDSSHPSHRMLSLLPSGRRLRSIRSHTKQLRDSFFSQAIRLMNNHPKVHFHFTVCHALHFNFNTVQLDYAHTLHCTLTFTQFNWTTCTHCTNTKKSGGFNAHPWHIELLYNLLHLRILLCVYTCT